MRIYRNGIYLSALLCIGVVLIILSDVIFSYSIHSSIENILLGTFASSLVVLITYIGAYFIEKKQTIGLIKHYCSNYVIELANLIPMIADINNGILSYNMSEVMSKIKSDESVHNEIMKLDKIHEERLLAVEGFYPIKRINKNNLEIHHLMGMLAKINASIQYCDTAYKLTNNPICHSEMKDMNYSDEKLKDYLKVILQTENTEYQEFLTILKSVINKNKPHTVLDSKWKEKCS